MTRAKHILFFVLILMGSCTDIDENVIPVVGIYRSHVVGIAGPFDLVISTYRGDDVIIDAPLDGYGYTTIRVDVNYENDREADFNIKRQFFDSSYLIEGNGFYRDGTIELRYTVDYGQGDKQSYTLVGTKL